MVLACFRANITVVLPAWPVPERQGHWDRLGPDGSGLTTTSTKNPPKTQPGPRESGQRVK